MTDRIMDFGSPLALLRHYDLKQSNAEAQKALGQYVLGMLTMDELRTVIGLASDKQYRWSTLRAGLA